MFDVSEDMSSVRRTFIPNIFLHQCCQPSFHNFSVMRQKAQPDKKNLHDNLPHTQTHKNTGPTNGLQKHFKSVSCANAFVSYGPRLLPSRTQKFPHPQMQIAQNVKYVHKRKTSIKP